MATQGWSGVTQADVTRRELKQALTPKGSKYKNVKTVHDGITFDSKREADRYVDLRVLLRTGDIRHLCVQVPFDLCAPAFHGGAPAVNGDRGALVVAQYVADFVYEEYDIFRREWARVVEDVKGKRTAMYQLKKKWLELQEGIVIREV